jgi:preprotein translocase subunit SecF
LPIEIKFHRKQKKLAIGNRKFYMIQIFKSINFDWLGYRKIFIAISVVIMLAGLGSAVVRQVSKGGTEAFNLGVDFKGGTVLTVKFKQPPTPEALRAAMSNAAVKDATIQPSIDKPDEFLIKLPLVLPTGENVAEADKAQVSAGRAAVKQALDTFGNEAAADKNLTDDANAGYKIIGTEAVGPIAGEQLRNQAIIVTLLALVGILLYIAFRFEWTYGVGAVIAVFHDVLVTLGFFSIFQWEVNLTVVAALLTLIGFSVNDSIVIFDRIRENIKLHRRTSLYDLANEAINQTMSRTIITGGLVFLSTLALVLFGGEVLRSFSLALFLGVIVGTYSTIAIASPIMIWWQQRLDAAANKPVPASSSSSSPTARATARNPRGERRSRVEKRA